MDVTRDNFEASLDALSEAIADPHFAFWSFDLEFTGLNASSATTFDLLDTPSDRFSKVHESCRRMTVLQYGVCCFAFHPSTRRWTARPFNFWLFPDAGRGSDAVFSCQASSMAFLADCGFDFNKAIRRGVPFVPAAERERNAQRRARAANRPPIVPTNERDKEMVRRLREDVAAWLERGEPPGDGDADPSDGNEDPSDLVRPISPDDLVLEPTNSFLRALTYQTLERETFGATNPPGYLATTRRDFPDGAARVVLRRASEAEIRADAEARAAKAASEERTRDGFAAALRLLCASGKPAVAHNALYDATFTLEKFLSDLDGSYEGFKSAFDDAIRGAFYDTKHLARTFADRWFADESRPAAPGDTAAVAAPPLDTALGPLYENLSSRPVPESRDGTTAPGRARGTPRGRARRAVEADANDAATILDAIDFPVGFDRYAAALRRPGPDAADDDDAVAALAKERASFAHEAGYDAYMTGVCFLTMALYGRGAVDADGVGSPRVFPADSRDGDGDGDGVIPPPGRRAVGLLGNAPFADEDGIIPLQHSDMSHVHLRGDDPIPDRSRVVYLVGLAPGTNGGELARRFRDAGLGNPSHVSWMRRDVARVIGAPIDERAMNDAANGDRLGSRSGSVAVNFDARSVERALRAGGLRAEVMSHDAWITRRNVAPSETSLGTFLARVGLGAKRAREASGAHDDGANGRKRARGDAEVAGSNSCAVM